MAYTFDDPKAPTRRTVQYFEMFGNRAIYADGWFASTIHRAPWEAKPRAALLDDKWELYDTRTDFSLANDIAAQHPAKLKELQALFMKEAEKYRVLPIDDRVLERLNAALVGRPDLMGGRTSLTLHAGMKGMSENVFINVKNRSLTITADVETPARGANGVVLAQGGRFGGWSLYFKDGKPIYTYNFLGLQRFTVAAAQAVAAGKATVRFVFAYDGGLGKGGLGTLYVNDKKVAEGRIEHTQAGIFSADETADVGVDDATPVTEAYKAWDNGFTGKIVKVTVNVKEMGAGEKTAAAGAEGAKK
jgi:arylsulfatase